jgi:hypothetical protein
MRGRTTSASDVSWWAVILAADDSIDDQYPLSLRPANFCRRSLDLLVDGKRGAGGGVPFRGCEIIAGGDEPMSAGGGEDRM